MTIVWPNSSTARRRSASTSRPAAESRLPVGSSAKITAGRVISARATATRCCWPPESSDGRWVRRSPSPMVSISVSSQAGSARSPAIRTGSSDVLLGGEDRQQVVALEDEADLRAPQQRELLVIERVEARAGDLDRAARRLVEPGEDVHQRRLAGARGAHDGGEVPGANDTSTPRRASTAASPSPKRFVSAEARTTSPAVAARAAPGGETTVDVLMSSSLRPQPLAVIASGPPSGFGGLRCARGGDRVVAGECSPSSSWKHSGTRLSAGSSTSVACSAASAWKASARIRRTPWPRRTVLPMSRRLQAGTTVVCDSIPSARTGTAARRRSWSSCAGAPSSGERATRTSRPRSARRSPTPSRSPAARPAMSRGALRGDDRRG